MVDKRGALPQRPGQALVQLLVARRRAQHRGRPLTPCSVALAEAERRLPGSPELVQAILLLVAKERRRGGKAMPSS